MRMSSILVVILGMMVTVNFGLNVCQHYGLVQEAPNFLPPNAYDVKLLGNGWHTFRLDIAGKKGRLFLHRLYPNYNNTESLTEIIEPQEIVPE